MTGCPHGCIDGVLRTGYCPIHWQDATRAAEPDVPVWVAALLVVATGIAFGVGIALLLDLSA